MPVSRVGEERCRMTSAKLVTREQISLVQFPVDWARSLKGFLIGPVTQDPAYSRVSPLLPGISGARGRIADGRRGGTVTLS